MPHSLPSPTFTSAPPAQRSTRCSHVSCRTSHRKRKRCISWAIFFEYWAGDDDLADPFHTAIAGNTGGLGPARHAHLHHAWQPRFSAERCLHARGASNAVARPLLLDLYGAPTLLMHGDSAVHRRCRLPTIPCHGAQRRMATQIPRATLRPTQSADRGSQKKERAGKSNKSAEIMDVNSDTVANTLRAQGYPRLIHGHTHRPARHS